MRFPDPYALRREIPKETILFAASQLSGGSNTQQDYFLNFNDECFAVADGIGGIPHGDVASRLASETAIWAYKHIRQHRYYWMDKKLFMKRIYRTTNLTIWQKKREREFADGLATTLMVLIVGPESFWLGNAGDSSAWMIHEGVVRKLTEEKEAFSEIPNHSLGFKRLGLIPDFVTMPLVAGDVLLLTTDGVADYLTTSDIQTSVSLSGNTNEDITRAVTSVLTAAQANGSRDNMTVLMVKRLPK